MNGTGKAGYIGPCPPDRSHRYFFRLYAIDIPLAGKMFQGSRSARGGDEGAHPPADRAGGELREDQEIGKSQIPNPKIQIQEIPTSPGDIGIWHLELGIWDFYFTWM